MSTRELDEADQIVASGEALNVVNHLISSNILSTSLYTSLLLSVCWIRAPPQLFLLRLPNFSGCVGMARLLLLVAIGV